MRTLNSGREMIADLAQRHAVSQEAAEHLMRAVLAGNGTQAQFNHPELGGMGQWSSGGMIMIGDMFNNALKFRVDQLCTELSQIVGATLQFDQGPETAWQSHSPWPDELGYPSSSGAQNDMRYAVFGLARRLAISRAGQVEVYDTGEHHIHGVSQQQGGGQWLSFVSQFGEVRLSDLRQVHPSASDAQPGATWLGERPVPERVAEGVAEPSAHPEPLRPEPAGSAPGRDAPAPDTADAILSTLGKLATLRDRGVLTDAEFEVQKAKLLGRL